MKLIHSAAMAALLAAMFVLPASAQGCLPGDPVCRPAPPGSVQVNPNATTGEAELASVLVPGQMMPLEAVVPMPLNGVAVAPLGSGSAAVFDSLAVPVRYQDPSDVSCGVQALGMALSALPGAAPTSPALLGFLQGHGMMYDFGTGVEELALAAQSFGYRGSAPFYGGDLASLASELDAGRPVVVSLGTNGTGAPGHFVTVTGVSPDGDWVSYNDPTLGRVTVSAAAFMNLWGLQGYSGVTVAAEPPAAAPDPYPWVALSAMVMALISTSPLGRQRLGIGGRITSGGGASPRPAPRPAPAPARPAPRPAPAPARPAPAPAPRPAPAPAPRGAERAEAAFQASPPPAPRPAPAPIPRAVERAEEAFEASLPPATVPAATTRARFDEEVPPTPQATTATPRPRTAGARFDGETTPTPILTDTPTPPRAPSSTPTPVVTLTPNPTQSSNPTTVPDQVIGGPQSGSLSIRGYPSLPGGTQSTVEGGTFIGLNPYAVSPSYGPRADVPGLPGLVLKAVSIVGSILRPYAYGEYLNSQESNVTARLSYSQSTEGTLLQSVLISNESGQALKVSVDVVRIGGVAYSSSPTWLLDGSTLLYSGEGADGRSSIAGLGLLGMEEPAVVWIGVVASFNDPPLLRSIELQVPSSDDAAVTIH